MRKFNICCVIGTRPEALKLIPVIKQLQLISSFEIQIIITGQHRELLTKLLQQANIQATVNFDVMSPNQGLSRLSSKLLEHFGNFFSAHSCDLVVAQGDTTSTLISAMTSFYNQIPFAHIEAGLRTSKIDNPFPEEWNRRIVSLSSTLHFCPTQLTAENLYRQGIRKNVFVTGNTIIDHLIYCTSLLPTTLTKTKKLILVTCHRRENFGKPLLNICSALKKIALRNKDIELFIPVHPNPNVKSIIHQHLAYIDNITLSPPLEYNDLIKLLKNCYLVLTDSGGLQEEAPAMRKPVLVLRTETERVEAISCGAAKLVGYDIETIIFEVENLLQNCKTYQQMCNAGSPYGDGHASVKIVRVIKNYLEQSKMQTQSHEIEYAI